MQQMNQNSVILGSARVEFRPYGEEDYKDLGLLRNLQIKFTGTSINIKADNGTVPISGVLSRKAEINFTLLERNLPLLNQVWGNLNLLEIEKGDLREFEEKRHFKKPQRYIFLNSQIMASELQIQTVKLNNSPLDKEQWDYYPVSGHHVLFFKDAVQGQISVTFTYESIKSYRLKGGPDGEIQPISLKITHKRVLGDGKQVRLTLYFPYCRFQGEDQIQFKSPVDTDALAEIPLSLLAEPDPNSDEPGALFEEVQDFH